MTKHYNRKSELEKRRYLRKNQTLAEKVVWTHLRNRRTLNYKFRRQYSVDHFVIDFYCPKLRLAIEIDGEIHQTQIEYDRAREEYIKKFNITFIRITNEELLGNPNKAFKKIEDGIKQLEATSPRPPLK